MNIDACLKDRFGTVIRNGDYVIHVGRGGSTLFITLKQVVDLHHKHGIAVKRITSYGRPVSSGKQRISYIKRSRNLVVTTGAYFIDNFVKE